MRCLEVNNSGPLKGQISAPGSKNSALAMFAASCMADEPVKLENIPDISDIRLQCSIGQDIGITTEFEKGTLTIDPRNIHSTDIDYRKSSSFRTAYYYIGALLARYKKVTVGYPGGDDFGSRPIDQHIKGLTALGAKFDFHEKYYVVQADRLTGTDIYFDVITSGATINLILAAVLANGRTVLHNAARDPEVVDVAVMLNKMGARIYGAGTDMIRIEGVSQLGGCTHQAIPDRLIAGSLFMSAGITGGEVTINDVIPEHLQSCMDKLTQIGLCFDVKESSIKVTANYPLKAARIRTGMYPIFATDYQQPATALLLKARGRSMVTDRLYPERFNHCHELAKMGADITMKNGSAIVTGGCNLKGAHVHASDIRAGICLLLAGLAAEGTTWISGVEHLERGYEDVIKVFTSLGADIALHENLEINTPNAARAARVLTNA